MKLLFVVVNREEHLESILSAFVELGVKGATIIDTVGMGRVLAHDIPIFAGLRYMFESPRPYNKTIFTVIEDELVEPVVNAIEEVCGPLDAPGTGIVFTTPVDGVWGLAKGL